MSHLQEAEQNRRKYGLTREQAIACYNRVDAWSQEVQERLRETILVPYFGGNLCCLHNWMLNYETHSKFSSLTKEEYKLGRYFNWKQNQIWDKAEQLRKHFASMF